MSREITFESRACPVCDKVDNSSLYAKENFSFDELSSFAFASRKLPEYMHYRLMYCEKCQIIYASVVPTEEIIRTFYTTASYDSSSEAKEAAITYEKYLSPYISKLSNLGHALDIGAGDGAFLEKLIEFKFSSVTGIEPSSAAIDAANPHIGKMISHGFFERSHYEDNAYSLVSCFQTLEHLPKPKLFCQSIYELLSPGGAFVSVTHNFRAFVNRLLGFKSPIFDIEHYQLYSEVGIKNLLHQEGFSKVEVFTIVNRYPVNYIFRLAPFPQKIKPLLTGLGESAIFKNLFIPAPFGNQMCIAWK